MTRKLKQIPLWLDLFLISFIILIANATYVSASGVSGLQTLWSGTSGWGTLWNGSSAWNTINFGGSIPATTSTTVILIPVVFGICGFIVLLCGVIFALTHNIKAVLVTAIAGVIIMLGIMLIQGVVTSLFSP